MRLLSLLALIALSAASCSKDNPNFCEGADCDPIDAAIDVPIDTPSGGSGNRLRFTTWPDPLTLPHMAAGRPTDRFGSPRDCVANHTGPGPAPGPEVTVAGEDVTPRGRGGLSIMR